MWNNLFKHIDIEPQNAHLLDGNATDLEKECAEFERKIQEAGGIQLFLGGIGPDGHIAFNEPGSSLVSRTRVKTLAQETIIANARFFGGDLSQVPTRALTVGVGTVMDAKEVLVYTRNHALKTLSFLLHLISLKIRVKMEAMIVFLVHTYPLSMPIICFKSFLV